MMIGAFVFRTYLLWLLLSVNHVCAGEDTGLVALMNTRYFALPAGIASGGRGDISYPTAVQNCEDNGGVLAAGYNKAALGQISNRCFALLGSWPCITFTGADGDATVTAPQCSNEPSSDSPSTTVCTYRYRFGFFDKYTYAGEPGTAFWLTYFPGGSEKEVNGYSTQWSTIFKRGTNGIPYGRKKIAVFLFANSYTPALVDIFKIPSTDDPVPSIYYIAVCEVQNVLSQFSTTSALPQPIMRQTWTDPTWAQSHWYVTFTILTLFSLIIIVVIFVYYSCRRREKPAEPPVHRLVIHELSGSLYTKQPTKQDRGVSFSDSTGGGRLRQGFGFNPLVTAPQKQADMDSVVQKQPTVHSRGDNILVCSQGNSVASDDSNSGRKVQTLTASRRAPSTSSKRSARRRSTYRVASQVFSDVELPQGGEINEDNVDSEL